MHRLARRVLPRRPVRPATAWLIAGLLALSLGRHFWRDEGELANILFTAAATGALISVLMLITRRALFATVLVAGMVALIVAAAAAKRAVMNMVVHAYDLFFYFSSWSTVSYLWSDQRRYVLGAAAAVAAVAFASWLSYRLDSTRVARPWSALALVAFAYDATAPAGLAAAIVAAVIGFVALHGHVAMANIVADLAPTHAAAGGRRADPPRFARTAPIVVIATVAAAGAVIRVVLAAPVATGVAGIARLVGGALAIAVATSHCRNSAPMS